MAIDEREEARRRLLVKLINATAGEQLAPRLFNDMHLVAGAFAELLSRSADDVECHRCASMLVDAIPEEERETVTATPEFMVALATMLRTSIEAYCTQLLATKGDPT